MKLDTRSFIVGFITAIVLYVLYTLFRARYSFYDGVQFNDNMSYDEARNLRNTELKRLIDDHAKKMETVQTVEEGDKFVAEHDDAIAKLEAQFAVFEMKKSQKSPAPVNAQEAPSVEEIAMGASPETSPAPAPETQVAPGPQTSTYEIEPYHA